MTMKREQALASPEELLRDKLVTFQREIAELKLAAGEQEAGFHKWEQELLSEIFQVLDAFDNLEKNLQDLPDPLEKTGIRFMKNTQAIKRKLLRLLSSRQIEPLEPVDKKAQIDQCRIVDTKQDSSLENEAILSVEKKGYIDQGRNLVLRKAEVVTVWNE